MNLLECGGWGLNMNWVRAGNATICWKSKNRAEMEPSSLSNNDVAKVADDDDDDDCSCNNNKSNDDDNVFDSTL